MKRKSCGLLINMFAILILFCSVSRAADVASWDFTKGAQGWKGNGYLHKVGADGEGVLYKGIGVDPWLEGPAFDAPAKTDLLVTIRMRTDSGASAELYYGRQFDEKNKVRFSTMPDWQWHDYSVFLPPLEPGARLRLDPFGDAGRFQIANIKISTASPVAPASLEKPVHPKKCSSMLNTVTSGAVVIENAGCSWSSFDIRINGEEMATAYGSDQIGWMNGATPEWISLNTAKPVSELFRNDQFSGTVQNFEFSDSTGANWKIIRKFGYEKGFPGFINVDITVSVDRDRDVIHIPWLTVFPGLDSFGEHKKQALFAGLEYLADEPSSSEADIRTMEHIRTVPDPVKITFPLMAIQNNGKYLGVIWQPSEYVAPVFDSPDRVFGSKSNLMALWAPGVGDKRRENSLFAYDTFKLKANEPVSVNFTLIGGSGDSVVPAVQQYVMLMGLPKLPKFDGVEKDEIEMLAGGWLDSELQSDGFWRHAVWGSSFPPGRAADAPMYMLQLANLTDDRALAARLEKGAARGLERLAEINPDTKQPFDPFFRSGVGHVRFPTPALLFGHVKDFVAQSVAEARQIILNDFDENGIRHYKPTPGRQDYGSTHFADHANGFTATDIYYILEAARLSGDEELIKKALGLLDKVTEMYANSEPRGAQTWEIPLHTPDILGSAYLVKDYVRAYSMTLDKKYLEQAKYWAWTGVPFVYLIQPVPGRVGPYSTIAVYGATSWQSPNWIGLPVQWCGLVYASALYELAEYDDDQSAPWERIAKGITLTGLQMSYPREDTKRAGLLPDSYNLKTQWRNGPDINPGTVQAHLVESLGTGKLYDFKKDDDKGWFVHAPCRLSKIIKGEFTAYGFGDRPYSILISHIEGTRFSVVFNDSGSAYEEEEKAEFEFYPDMKILIIKNIVGPKKIKVERMR